MKIQNKFQFIILLLLNFIGKYSCQSNKEIIPKFLSQKTDEERLDKIIQSEIKYNTFSSNLKIFIQLKEKKNIPVDTQIRIIKDKIIQISLRIPLLGIEAYRISITPNDIVIIDRIHKQYFQESMQNLKNNMNLFNFDYYVIVESLLNNKLFIPNKKEILPYDYSNFHINEEQFVSNFIYTDKYNTIYKFVIDDTNRLLSTVINTGSDLLQCQYYDWKSISDKNIFPMSIQLIFNKNYKFNLFFKSIKIDTNFSFDDNIPYKYKQTTFKQIIQHIII